MKIAIAGTGYVGLSLAVLLSEKHEVMALDVVPEKVEMINNRMSPIRDKYIEEFMFETKKGERVMNLTATLDYKEAFKNANFVIISTPTNYDDEKNFFDTSSVEDIIQKVISTGDKNITIIIKSTIPVGFTEKVRKKYDFKNIFFSPEFLREGNALYDNLHPSRIIVGGVTDKAKEFANLLKEASKDEDTEVLLMQNTEAEAVKLFANTYLALRVAYFNELDTYARVKNLNTKNIIRGVCLDPRIGTHYNNPSFGYGGYCLPKDTKQLLANYRDVPQNLIESIVRSNKTRKQFIAKEIIRLNPEVIGVYRLIMKYGSDNFRSSAIQDIINIFKEYNKTVVIYEPTLKEQEFNGCRIVNDLNEFKNMSSVIIANRFSPEISDVSDRIYTRDLFMCD